MVEKHYKSELLRLDVPNLTKIDLFIGPLVTIAGAIWMFTFIGTAINWDDLLYLDMALKPTPQGWLFNRYGHIYLLKLFLFFTNDSITSGKIYWLAMFWGTGLLVYWSTRLIAGKKSYLAAMVAALLFYIQPVFAKEFGCPLADITVMFLTVLAVFIYLIFLYHPKSRIWPLMALGLIFFWAIKSKETGICLAILFLGLGCNEEKCWNFKCFIKNLAWVCIGIAAGCFILIILDTIFLKDPIFSLRISAINEVLEYNVNKPGKLRPLTRAREVMSWYAGIAKKPFLTALFVPFVLYLIEGIKQSNKKYALGEKFIWLTPLVLLIFLTYIRSRFWILERYFIPAIPVICVWAGKAFYFQTSELFTHKKVMTPIYRWAAIFTLVLSAFIIVYIFMRFMSDISEFYNFMRYDVLKAKFKTNENVFYAVGIVPLMATIFLIMNALIPKKNLAVIFISSFCLFMLILHPLKTNKPIMESTALKSEWRFLPYKVFSDNFEFDEDVKVLVSGDIYKRSWMLGNSLRKQRWFFNIFFNKKYTNDNFIYATELQDITKCNYTYALISGWDWQRLYDKYPDDIDKIKKQYFIRMEKVGEKMPILLLKQQ